MRLWLSNSVVWLLVVASVRGLTTMKPPVSGNMGALMYLAKYGHMNASLSNPKTGNLISADSMRQAIMGFQEFASLNVTGDLDEETIRMMNMPRCGVKDKIGFGSYARRRKRYALQGSRWRVKTLTYKVSKYPGELTRSEVDRDIRKAFEVWENVANLKFNLPLNSSEKIHIDIRFESGEHGDGDPFDGPGGTLAHAYFPIYGGDVHFDSSETWTVKSYRGTNLFQVAAHEFGHSLGLSHSDNQGALMAAFYRGYQPNFELHRDDIKAIQSLYEAKVTSRDGTADIPVSEKPPSSDSELCSDPTFDAIVSMVDRKTYVFKGEKYYKLTKDGIDTGYPRSIEKDWGGLEGNIDAAFTWTNGKTYFFKGKLYWRFTNLVMDGGYPKNITKGFAGIPDDVDAAYVWSGNGKIYFIKGSEYWRFDTKQKPPVKRNYPKALSNWDGIPDNVNGVLQYTNGYTYFFEADNYYRFNDRAFRVDSADPPFPRSTGYWWFGCPDNADQRMQQSLQGDQEEIFSIPGADDVYDDDTIAAVSGYNVDMDTSGSTR